MRLLALRHVPVDGHRNRVRLRHRHLNLLQYLHGEGFLHLDRVGLLHRVRDGPLDDLRHDLVHRHLYLLLDVHLHRVRLGHVDFHVLRDGHRNGMRHGDADLLVNWNRVTVRLLRVRYDRIVVNFVTLGTQRYGIVVRSRTADVLVLVERGLVEVRVAVATALYRCRTELCRQCYDDQQLNVCLCVEKKMRKQTSNNLKQLLQHLGQRVFRAKPCKTP